MAKVIEARIAALERLVPPEGPCEACKIYARVFDVPVPATCSCEPIAYEDMVRRLKSRSSSHPKRRDEPAAKPRSDP